MKKRWKLLIAVCIVVIWIVPGLLKNTVIKNFKDDVLSKDYQGVVARVKYIKGNRGMPILVFADSTQIELDIIDEKIVRIIKKGDSISKESGKLYAIIYRKNLEDTRDSIRIRFE